MKNMLLAAVLVCGCAGDEVAQPTKESCFLESSELVVMEVLNPAGPNASPRDMSLASSDPESCEWSVETTWIAIPIQVIFRINRSLWLGGTGSGKGITPGETIELSPSETRATPTLLVDLPHEGPWKFVLDLEQLTVAVELVTQAAVDVSLSNPPLQLAAGIFK